MKLFHKSVKGYFRSCIWINVGLSQLICKYAIEQHSPISHAIKY